MRCWNTTTAVRVDGPLSRVDLGSTHACGLYFDDTAVCWGTDLDGQLAIP